MEVPHLQKEMGAVTRTTPFKNPRKYDYILGVGATDGGDNPKWAGVDKQLLGAVLTCMKWYNFGQKNNIYPIKYISSEQRKIMIQNSSTFSLYKYTPWIGDQPMVINKAKYEAPFGNALFHSIHQRWFEN